MSSGSGASGAPAGTVSGAYLLDSSVLIRSLRGDTVIGARIGNAPQVFVSSIVLGELYFGAYGSPTRPEAALADVERVETTIAALALDATTARVYAQVKLNLKRRGYSMPDNDVWIAATAIQYNVTLAARDAHFDWIDGLRVEQW